MVQQHIGTKLVQCSKLQGQIRPLFVKILEATPENLLECFKWLRENDPYCRARESPMVVSLLPSKYPEWVTYPRKGVQFHVRLGIKKGGFGW